MKKIIITSPSLNPNKNVSGISSVTGFIIRNNSDYEYQHFELGKYDGQKRNLLWCLRNLLSWFRWFILIIRKPNSLIHFNIALTMRSVLRDLPLLLFAQFLNKKVVIHVHGGDYLEEKKAPKWIHYLLKRCFSGYEPKIVLSPVEKELLNKSFAAKNIHVLPNCIDLTDAQEFNGNKNLELPLNLLFIGRIDRNKGLDYIYDALSLLNSNKKNYFKFTMAGNGPDKKEFIEKFTKLLGNSFEYKGVVQGNDKISLFKTSNIFLLPSLYEGLPISLLENMSFGNVPIVTNVGSIGTVVSNGLNGIIVKKQSAEEIANSIEFLASDPGTLKKLGENARHQIFKNFNPKKYIQKLNSTYVQLYEKKNTTYKMESVNETSTNSKAVDKRKAKVPVRPL